MTEHPPVEGMILSLNKLGSGVAKFDKNIPDCLRLTGLED
jgi:hypothetical protein